MDIRFQIKKMVRSLQYRVAFLISSLCVCVALLLETWKAKFTFLCENYKYSQCEYSVSGCCGTGNGKCRKN